MKQVLLYLPVIHAGYEEFLGRHADADAVLLLGAGFRGSYRALGKDIRALSPQHAAAHLRLILPEVAVRVIEPPDLPGAVTAQLLVMPDEEITRDLADRYHLAEGRRLVLERTFLRWDRQWATTPAPPAIDAEISTGQLPRELLGLAATRAARSSNWWRQVGAVAARGGRVLGSAWNRHLPTEYAPYLDGDPRDAFSRGIRTDLATAIHAEAAVIGQAARDGVALAGADIYTTTFPCPACAHLIAEAGFARCYFAGGYSLLDGARVLRTAGVRLIRVAPDPAGPGPAGN